MPLIASIRENLIAWVVGSVLASIGTLGVGYYHYLKETVIEDQLQSAKAHKSEGFRMFQRGETALAHYRYGQAAAVLRTLAYWGSHEAQFELGKLLCVGWGVGKNQKLATELFRQANLSDEERMRLAENKDLGHCLPEFPKT